MPERVSSKTKNMVLWQGWSYQDGVERIHSYCIPCYVSMACIARLERVLDNGYLNVEIGSELLA
jgi:hypothetical protein